jgi:hypothetical protein
MRLEPSAGSRRVIVPWYDADGICIAAMAGLLSVAGFAGVGVWVALSQPDFAPHASLALVLAGAALLPAATIGLRLFRRRRGRR